MQFLVTAADFFLQNYNVISLDLPSDLESERVFQKSTVNWAIPSIQSTFVMHCLLNEKTCDWRGQKEQKRWNPGEDALTKMRQCRRRRGKWRGKRGKKRQTKENKQWEIKSPECERPTAHAVIPSGLLTQHVCVCLNEWRSARVKNDPYMGLCM